MMILASLAIVVWRVDLTPQVASDFFFATDDPDLQPSREIAELFPAGQQLLIQARAEDILAETYLERLHELTTELASLAGISEVQSLTSGPATPQAAIASPIWSRLLLARTPARGDSQPPRPTSSLVIATLAETTNDSLIASVEALLARHHSPAFALEMSGVPYVIELIRRHLLRDLRVFTVAALVVFGLLVAAVYRSWRLAAAMLATCLSAGALTLATLHLLGAAIGLLTANIVTIVFVLTLSHVVFLTANWRRLAATRAPVAGAIERTFGASFWSMLTTLLGFASLLTASAKPLRELGLSGAVGTLAAILVAYGLFPAFLRRIPSPALATSSSRSLAVARGAPTMIVIAVVTVIASFGLSRLDTDPGLLAYFAAGDEIRSGLEAFDRAGGSSPLFLVVRDPASGRLDSPAAVEKLQSLQAAIDSEPAVGISLSLPVLLAEAKQNPLAFLLSWEKLLDLLETPLYDEVARKFITADRQRGLFLMRMRELDRDEPRQEIIDRLIARVAEQGLEAELVGGLYDLQGKLGQLVASSLVRGLAALVVLFLLIAAVVSRSPRITAAMVVSLTAVPILVLGTLGHFGQPLDFISSPAANIAIALGIDSMIHLVTAVRRQRQAGQSSADAWSAATGELRPPILGATLILMMGFGIFALSSFPPTQRFGIAVALGTGIAAAMALIVLPRLASGTREPQN